MDDAKVVALIKGDEEVQSLDEGDAGEVVLDRTPFYAESGGQVGDVGVFVSETAHADVADTYSPAQGLIVHKVTVEKGGLKVGDKVAAIVDAEKRDATRRNHTATHLMHAALREVLGTHVKQAGSVVAPNYLRFDFAHYQPLTRDEIAEIERLVNFQILRNERVRTDVLTLEEAMRSGAMALFGEKYAERVRVLTVPGIVEGEAFSKELCGGTHVRATGDIGLFKIVSDESIASGTRRIRAVTGADAFLRFQETEALVDQLSAELRATRPDIPAAISRLQEELKKSRRESDELRMKLAMGGGGSASNGVEAREVADGVLVLAREASDLDAQALRQLSDTLLAQIKSGVVVLGPTRRRQGFAHRPHLVRPLEARARRAGHQGTRAHHRRARRRQARHGGGRRPRAAETRGGARSELRRRREPRHEERRRRLRGRGKRVKGEEAKRKRRAACLSSTNDERHAVFSPQPRMSTRLLILPFALSPFDLFPFALCGACFRRWFSVCPSARCSSSQG